VFRTRSCFIAFVLDIPNGVWPLNRAVGRAYIDIIIYVKQCLAPARGPAGVRGARARLSLLLCPVLCAGRGALGVLLGDGPPRFPRGFLACPGLGAVPPRFLAPAGSWQLATSRLFAICNARSCLVQRRAAAVRAWRSMDLPTMCKDLMVLCEASSMILSPKAIGPEFSCTTPYQIVRRKWLL
jgi:hypothetical protein